MAKEKETKVTEATKVEEVATPSEATAVEVVEEKPVKRRRRSRKEKAAEEAAEAAALAAREKPEEVRATAKAVRVTARKAKLVVDLVRGKKVSEALGILANVNKSATLAVTKTIKSAAANAINNFGFDEDRLYISEIYANEGSTMKRYRPRAKGGAAGIKKRTSHITVVVKERE